MSAPMIRRHGAGEAADAGRRLREDAYSCLKDADAMCLVTEWTPSAGSISSGPSVLKEEPVVIDLRNVYSVAEIVAPGFRYVRSRPGARRLRAKLRCCQADRKSLELRTSPRFIQAARGTPGLKRGVTAGLEVLPADERTFLLNRRSAKRIGCGSSRPRRRTSGAIAGAGSAAIARSVVERAGGCSQPVVQPAAGLALVETKDGCQRCAI